MCARAAWQESWLAQGALLGGLMQSREARREAQFLFFQNPHRPPKSYPWALFAKDRAQCRPPPSIGLRFHRMGTLRGFLLQAPDRLRTPGVRRYFVSHRFLLFLVLFFFTKKKKGGAGAGGRAREEHTPQRKNPKHEIRNPKRFEYSNF